MIRRRILLIVLLAWALVMIVPDVLLVATPLTSFGFYADNDGLIYDVIGPFDEREQSPAWNAGIRVGDRLARGCQAIESRLNLKARIGVPAGGGRAIAEHQR